MSDLNLEADPEVPQQDEIDAKAEGLVMIARTLVLDWPRFYTMLEPKAARYGIHAFKAELRSRAFAELCVDYAQKPICGGALALDYLIGSTVVEIAMDLRDDNSEFERDILQVLIAESELHSISHLLFLAKTGARARCNTPARKALADWVEREYGVRVEVRELGLFAERILNISE
jgi:hypothetical protein